MPADGIPFNAPATRQRIESLLARLQLQPGNRVVDIGCGRGEMLHILAESCAINGVGIDPDESEINIARRLQPSRGSLTWHNAKVQDVTLEPGFDAAICIGAAHAFGHLPESLPRAFEQLRAMIRDRGRILIGLGYWMQPPSQPYLDATGLEAGELLTHEANIATAESAGLKCIHTEASSPAEWNEFESAFLRTAQQRAAKSPNDAIAIASLKHWQSWNAAFRQWGHHTMGFAFYLLEK